MEYNREELILSCQECVSRLVRKYNNHMPDEDLQSIGMIAVIECVDRCLSENMTDINQIQSRCNVWAKNRILNDIYKEKIKFVDDELALELVPAHESDFELRDYIESELTPRQLEVVDLLIEGYDPKEIQEKLNISVPMYYKHLTNIKEKLKNRV